MITFTVENTGIEFLRKQIEAIAPKQLPFIMALALTETARDVELVVKREMQRTIDRPKPFTLNSLYSTRATKTKQEASVLWREFAGKGTPGGKYLRPIAEGGSRPLKRSEVALKRMGALPQGYYVTPGGDAKLDQYGNIPGSMYVQVLSALKAFGEVGYVANRTAQSAKRKGARLKEFFAVNPNSGSRLAPGVYQRMRRGLKLILAFVRAPSYRVRFPFKDVSIKTAQERMPKHFSDAIAKALATAKPGRLK